MEIAKRKSRSSSSKLEDTGFEINSCENKLPRRRGRARMASSLLDRLAPTPGFVDKPSVEVEGDSLARRRTPRMASLNAAAKVNLFFEPSSPLAGRSLMDIHHHSRRVSKGSTEKDSDDGLRNGSTLYDDDLFETDEYISTEISLTSDNHMSCEWQIPKDKQEKIKDFSTTSNEFHSENGSKEIPKHGQKRKLEADSTSEGIKRGRKKFDINNMLYEKEHRLELECDTTTEYDSKTMVDACIQVDLPRPTLPLKHIRVLSVPIKGQIFTTSGSIPFTKSHLITPGAPPRPPVEHMISKTASTKRTANLNAQAMLNAMMAKEGPLHKMRGAGDIFAQRTKYRKSSKENNLSKFSQDSVKFAPLRIPKINFAATSTSNFSLGRHRPAGNPVKNIYLKNLNMQLEKLQAERVQEPRKHRRTNGWTYHGEPLDKPYCYDDKIVIRHYYSGIQRGDEIINVRDSVLLKAGTRRKDQPFVARVSGLWEEHDGPNAGEMMMSVFWYYRPEQTEVGRLPHIHGQMEVMASRHKDDNSVACIVDKCYVLSYPEYCRYRAQNRLFRESRSVPLSPVPPGESTKPGSVPPSNTDPLLVFFCRQIYDHRMGRIIKNPWY